MAENYGNPRRYYKRERFVCPECQLDLVWIQRLGKLDSMLLRHDPHPRCSRAGKLYYPPVVELELFDPNLFAETMPLAATAGECPQLTKRPPFETFKGPICKGCYALGSACGRCEKCAWERQQMAPGAIAEAPHV